MKKILQKLFLKFSEYVNFRLVDNRIYILFFGIKIRISYKGKFKVPNITASGVTSTKRQTPIVLSLTSFPKRIHVVPDVVKTLLNQTLKPDYIVLYLSIEQFPAKEKDLPSELLELRNYGLEIRWCEGDIKSYKKLIPALKDFKDSIIITFDDDIYYENDVVESLYNAHLKDKTAICTKRARRLYLAGDSIAVYDRIKILNYSFDIPSYKNCLVGHAGILYPPDSLYKDVAREDLFLELLPTHDDIWFWAMSVLNNTKTIVVDGFKKNVFFVDEIQDCGLCKINTCENNSSTLGAINKIAGKYSEILEKLKSAD